MMKVNVGLSRKLSRDYNSTGFSLNLEGELCVGLDDPVAMIERVKEFYDLAEEALNQQIERYESETAIAGRDEVRPANSNGHSPTPPAKASTGNGEQNSHNGNGDANQSGNGQSNNGDVATNKQVQYLLNIGKRQGLTLPQLEGRIEGILNKKVGVYNLTKREAGSVIDTLSQNGQNATLVTNGNGRSRNGH